MYQVHIYSPCTPAGLNPGPGSDYLLPGALNIQIQLRKEIPADLKKASQD
jgi:hypothetical protein